MKGLDLLRFNFMARDSPFLCLVTGWRGGPCSLRHSVVTGHRAGMFPGGTSAQRAFSLRGHSEAHRPNRRGSCQEGVLGSRGQCGVLNSLRTEGE